MYLQLVDPSLGFHGVQGSKAFPLTQVVVPQVEAGANGRSMEDLSKESPSSYLIDCLLAVAAGTAGSAFAQPSVSWPHASHSVVMAICVSLAVSWVKESGVDRAPQSRGACRCPCAGCAVRELLTSSGDMVFMAWSAHAGTDAPPRPGLGAKDAQMHVLPVPLNLVTGISALRISVPGDLRPREARQAALDTVRVRSPFRIWVLVRRLCAMISHFQAWGNKNLGILL